MQPSQISSNFMKTIKTQYDKKRSSDKPTTNIRGHINYYRLLSLLPPLQKLPHFY